MWIAGSAASAPECRIWRKTCGIALRRWHLSSDLKEQWPPALWSWKKGSQRKQQGQRPWGGNQQGHLSRMIIRKAGTEAWKGAVRWNRGTGRRTFWDTVPDKSMDFILIATETCGNFNLECGVICFTSWKDHLIYSMENGIVVMRMEKQRGKEAIYFGVALL